MPYSVTQADILSIRADAAVICIENTMEVSEDPVSQALAEAGGETLQKALRRRLFLPVGSACAVDPCDLPFRHLFAVGTPQWRNGESNELLVLRRCYESIYHRWPAKRAARVSLRPSSQRPTTASRWKRPYRSRGKKQAVLKAIRSSWPRRPHCMP